MLETDVCLEIYPGRITLSIFLFDILHEEKVFLISFFTNKTLVSSTKLVNFALLVVFISFVIQHVHSFVAIKMKITTFFSLFERDKL